MLSINMNTMPLKNIVNQLIAIAFILFTVPQLHAEIIFKQGKELKIALDMSTPDQVVRTALEIFKKDYQTVFDTEILEGRQGTIRIGTLGISPSIQQHLSGLDIKTLQQHPEGFLIQVIKNQLIVFGSDKRGTAYGILELSRMIGVSPWEWWADARPLKRKKYTFDSDFKHIDYPSVAHRGIFLNDEDFALLPWSSLTHEPESKTGEIGPRTHERIFELLLRLRANTFWPAMHECTVAFYLTPKNKEIADKYGIYIGTSHCEPMMRNTNAEWKIAGNGTYDYVNNRDHVVKFWEERVKQLAGSDNIYTLGIRGVHDSKMLGANTLEEQYVALTNIIKDQRKLIADFVNPNVEKVSQVFIPYKEVLDVYKLGLEVPDDVTLVWCDDNYGYIRHFPTAEEQQRAGGSGMYYHASYWGRPHDYLWLSTNHPALVYSQMKTAYDKGVKNTWILNVGDIKPAEFTIEMFLDMAWNIDKIQDSKEGIYQYMNDWYSREFGKKIGSELTEIANEYYRLAYIRKPEFMGNTRTEEKDPYTKKVKDLAWSENEIRERIKDYDQLDRRVVKLTNKISPLQQSSWFQLVEYPVRASAAMNQKHLYAQLARHDKGAWEDSDLAFDKVESLTQQYDTITNGKWKRMMNHQPRNLEVFHRVPRENAPSKMKSATVYVAILDGTDYDYYTGELPKSYGLGYNSKAIHINDTTAVNYTVKTGNKDSLNIDFALAPNHPVNGDKLRFTVSINNNEEQIFEIQTVGRSEEWKENVLTNRTIRGLKFLNSTDKLHIKVRALDEGIVLDQILVY
jgi:FKBP-type peptidyl-prolyl cis-trans isomerase 2